MQRVSALLPSWNQSRSSTGSTTSKTSLDKVRGWADFIPSPVNRLSGSRLGKEAFWPGTLDKECEKAARILKAFCRDGLFAPDDRPSSPSTTASGSSAQSRVLKKIPPRIIQNAVGLAVFTSMRSGLWTSGSGGSGVLIARKSDGTWSPPSGLMLQTAALGFLLGVDAYDCVVVINTFTMLEAIGRPKVTLGTDVAMTAGPLVALGLLENDVGFTDLSDTVFTYVKSKGQLADVKLDGTILNERTDENDRFYGNSFSVPKILAGDVNQSMPQLRPLTEVLKAAEGRSDFDESLLDQLSSFPAPSDATIEPPAGAGSQVSLAFGIPDVDDPDPYGVLALEMAGLEIREAGTKQRPDSSQFEYCPSPSSSFFPRASRRSADTSSLSRSNRCSYMSSRTMATERSHMTDAGTQTYVHTPATTPSPEQSEDGRQSSVGHETKELEPIQEPEEVDYTKIDITALRKLSAFPDLEEPLDAATPATMEDRFEAQHKDHDSRSSTTHSDNENGMDRDDDEDEDKDDTDIDDVDEDDDDDEEEPVVFEVATAQPPRMAIVAAQAVQAKGSVVTIPRRVPPPVPTRSPARLSRRSKSEFGDVSMVSSPLRQEFAQGEEASTPRAEDAFPASTKGDMEKTSAVGSDGGETPPHTPIEKTASASPSKLSAQRDELPAEALAAVPTALRQEGKAGIKADAAATVSVA